MTESVLRLSIHSSYSILFYFNSSGCGSIIIGLLVIMLLVIGLLVTGLLATGLLAYLMTKTDNTPPLFLILLSSVLKYSTVLDLRGHL